MRNVIIKLIYIQVIYYLINAYDRAANLINNNLILIVR